MSQRNPIHHNSRRTFVATAGVFLLGAALCPAGARAQANAKRSRIGVVGSGNIGGTIGGLWVLAV
jgi:8-hydroxy-5-deazaflavin:NADPH oxidoreductase